MLAGAWRREVKSTILVIHPWYEDEGGGKLYFNE
jgi:hypothetical protein